jgi:hypothetical protein
LKELTLRKAVRRIFLYFGLALAFLTVFALVFALSIHTGIVIPYRWFGLAFWTPLLFWWVIRPLKRHWKRPAFWGAVSGLLVLHLLASIAALVRFPQWPMIWFVPVSIVEAGLFTVVLIKLFDHASG